MNKKTRNVLLLVILAVVCLLVFAACNKIPDINTYADDDLGVMGKLVRWMHSWVGNYGWTVVVFTVFLKILMLPLDIWQRYASRKSTLKMQQMQPVIDGIDKRYGANTQRANEEKQKLYKKQGFSMMSSCLPMIVSMVIFFIMFAGLRNYSTYSSIKNFKELSNTYYETYSTQILDTKDEHYNAELAKIYQENYDVAYNTAKNDEDIKDNEEIADLKGKIAGIVAAQEFDANTCELYRANAIEQVKQYYLDHHESWLWIKNVWQPDTWASVMQKYEGGQFDGGGFSTSVNLEKYPDGAKGVKTYEIIRQAVLEIDNVGHGKNGTWNGLMILPVMSVGLSFLSMFISQRMERKNRKGEVVQQNAQQATTNKMMMFMMPLMMAFFGFMYTGAFAIYMVVNYSLSILSTIALRRPVEKIVNRNLNKAEHKNKSDKASYMR
ncbi:MAG: membrane protein insertase YidC [Clostridiales bacterium]|nr:membrane protein insertase YidC [Clostridiales bacterium]